MAKNKVKIKEYKGAFFDLNVRFIDEKKQKPTIVYGEMVAPQMKILSVGSGSKVFRADEQGIWLGAEKFQNAPFRVDMEGNLYASSAVIGNYLSKVDNGQILTGSIYVGNPSGGYVFLDGNNIRILLHDGTVNRGVWGNV